MRDKVLRIAFAGLIALSLVAFFLPISSVHASGTTYYVAKTGSDSNDGSLAHPWLTIQKAVDTMAAGDTVYIHGGTYAESVTIYMKSGTPTNRITFKKYPGETPIIDATGYSNAININYSSYLTFDGLEIENATNASIGANYGQIHYIEFSNLTIHDSGGSAFSIGAGGYFGYVTHILVNNCLVHDVCQLGVGSDEGISLQSVDSFEIKNNTVYNTPNIPEVYNQTGIDAKVGCRNGTIHNNNVSTTAIYVDAFGETTSGISIYNNYIHDSATVGLVIGCEDTPASVTGINIYNNIFYHVGTTAAGAVLVSGEAGGFTALTFTLVNNTFYSNGGSGWSDIIFGDATGNYSNCVIRNNIIVTATSNTRPIVNQYPANGGTTIDHNLFYCLSGELYAESAGVPRGSNVVLGDPLLVNPGTNFSIGSSSPARNAGISTSAPSTDYAGIARPQNTLFDIGAYEYYTTPTPTPTPTPTYTFSQPGLPANPPDAPINNANPNLLGFGVFALLLVGIIYQVFKKMGK